MEYCTRCQLTPEEDLLRELAHSRTRSVRDLIKQSQWRPESSLAKTSQKYRDERLRETKARLEQYEEELRRYEENASYQAMESILHGESIEEIAQRILEDEYRRELEEKVRELKWKPQGIDEEDVRQALEEYRKEGYIDIVEGKVKITSKGAKRLASHALERILRNLSRKDVGTHSVEEVGFGSELSTYARKYEAGDDYSLVDVEKTALNALERKGRLELELEDFEVHEEIHQSRLCAGLIIDESGSMRNNYKFEAAIETALALSELISREPKDALKVFVFSERVREIPPWGIVNEVMSGGCTDIRAAMEAFRKAIINEKGDKQAYLITDTEPNTENGRYIGFNQAAIGVMDEALRYRQQNIGLNIIMLDESPRLRELASALARRNLGRVFFTSPLKLGEVIVEDYLRSRKGRI